jgi:hypothetical protein
MDYRKMKTCCWIQAPFVLFLLTASLVTSGVAMPPHRVMLLTGVNNHDWRSTTPPMEAALSNAGVFAVTTITTPPLDAPAEAWHTNRFDLRSYDAIVMNWTDFGGKPATRPWMDELVRYVTNGGALVIVHAASLEYHPAWPAIAGLGWHGADFGDRLSVNDQGEVTRTPKEQGPGSGHGPVFAWPVTFRAANHPVASGLPMTWPHKEDELWHGTRGPAENLEVIASAYSPLTKTNEPVMWTVKAGKGRVFVTLLGHDARAMSCSGFGHTLARGCEWAITGKVTLQPPPDFPKAVPTYDGKPASKQ